MSIEPREVLLLRHQDWRARRRQTPYHLWRADRLLFEDYQSRQRTGGRYRFDRPYWASFVASPAGETIFVGLYRNEGARASTEDWLAPHSGEVRPAGADRVYALELAANLSDLSGRLIIDWGDGTRSWVQGADRRDKLVIELRRAFEDRAYPGHDDFVTALSDLDALPPNWASVLSAACGVYVLTCPRTREQYVGSATGADGFLGRWRNYARTGHGENTALKHREPSDFTVAILEVAGSRASEEDILAMEARWKRKLFSREIGLNRN